MPIPSVRQGPRPAAPLVALAALLVVAAPARGHAAEADTTRQRAVAAPADTAPPTARPRPLPGLDLLADDDLVAAPVADPRTPRFAVFQTWMSPTGLPGTVATASFGGEVGILRWTSARGTSIQVGAAGGMSAAFDMGAQSNDLMNEDYLVGFPIAVRAGRAGLRVTPYHVSSHLGDEFAERTGRPRSHITFEAVDAIVSIDAGGARAYAGGVYRQPGQPAALRRTGGQWGAELRRPICARCWPGGRLGARWIGALDVRTGERRGTPAGWSGAAGIELAEPGPALDGRLTLLLSAYAGPAPYQQFAEQYVRSIGLGIVVAP